MSLPPITGHNQENSSGEPKPYYSQGSSEYPETIYSDKTAPATVPRNRIRKASIIAGASVLSLAVLAGGGFAAASVLHQMSDHDIAVALPQSTSAFAQADLNPSPGQKINIASVAGKIKDISGKDYDTNKDPKQLFTDPFFSNLDYKTDVQPWLGDKVAFGAWGDLSSAAKDGYSNRDVAKDANAVVVYEIKDKAKADEAAKKIKDKDIVHEVNDHYLILAGGQSVLDSYNAEMAKGTLDKNKTFNDDRALLKGQDDVATAWIDATELHAGKAVADYMSRSVGATGYVPKDINGRIVTGLSLDNNSVKVSSKLVGFDTADYSAEKGLSDVANLPDSSNVVFSVKDAKTPATKFFNSYKEASGPSSTRSMDRQLERIGIVLPDDFGALLGTQTSVGASVKDDSNYGFTYRAKDGDTAKIRNLVKASGGGTQVTTSEDNGSTVVEYHPSDNGKLGDSKAFQKAVGDLSKAQALVYVDINSLMHEAHKKNDEHPNVDYGAAALTSSLDPSSKVISVDINWAF